MTPINLIIFGIVVLAALVAFRARNPTVGERQLIANPAKYPGVVGLYILRGFGTFIDPSANSSLEYSIRYGGTPFSLRTAGWALGLASVFVTAAIFLGWALFDITTIGDWGFFPEEIPAAQRFTRTGITLLALFLFVYTAADIIHITNNIPEGLAVFLLRMYYISIPVLFILGTIFYGNTGLMILAGGVVLLLPFLRGQMLFVLIASPPFIAWTAVSDLGAAHVALIALMISVALMALVAFVVTIGILSLLRWYDPADLGVAIGYLGAIILGFLCAFLVPALAFNLLNGTSQFAPPGVQEEWLLIFDQARTGGLPTAAMLAFCSIPPLLPALWFTTSGLGTAIGRGTPMMRRFIAKLRTEGGPVTLDEYNALIRPYQWSRAFGHFFATLIAAALLATLLWLLSHAFLALFAR